MTAIWLSVLLASLAGSLHCAAMCGPFVAAVAGFDQPGRHRVLTHAAYHLGRLLTYLGLGTAAGLLGGALDVAGGVAGLGRISAIVAGALLVSWGASTLLAPRGLVALRRRAPQRLGTLLGSVLARVQKSPPAARGLLLGLSTTLVPCGWLYAFVATAAATGRVAPALGVMFAFWLGSVPALVGAGVGLRGVFARLGSHARTLSGSLILASGIALIAVRVGIPSADSSTELGTPRAATMPEGCPLHPRSP